MILKKRSTLNLNVVFALEIVLGIMEVVYNHSHTMFVVLGIQVLLVIVLIMARKGTVDFEKLVERLPGDHKLITRDVAVIDIGDYRFIYKTYAKGFVSRSYVSLEAGIPFLLVDCERGEYSAAGAITLELQNLIDNLRREGLLTGFYSVVNDKEDDDDSATSIGQPILLEFLIKDLASGRLADVQGRIVDIIKKFNLQDVSWCMIRGGEYGTEYYYSKGNLLQSTILLKGAFDIIRSDYKHKAQLYMSEHENLFSVEGYLELYDHASRDLGESGFQKRELRKKIELMFKKTQFHVTGMMECENELQFSLFNRKSHSASEYHLTFSDGYWWIYAHGLLDTFDPISTLDESTACDLLLRFLSRHISALIL